MYLPPGLKELFESAYDTPDYLDLIPPLFSSALGAYAFIYVAL